MRIFCNYSAQGWKWHKRSDFFKVAPKNLEKSAAYTEYMSIFYKFLGVRLRKYARFYPVVNGYDYKIAKACCRSSFKSSKASIPTESRIKLSVIPIFSRSKMGIEA